MSHTLRQLLPLVLLVITACGGGGSGAKLNALFEEDWEWTLENYPTTATFYGDPRYNDKFSDISVSAIHRRQAYARDILQRLDRMDRDRFSDTDKINYDLFRQQFASDVESQAFPTWQMPINQMGGVQINLPGLNNVTPFKTVQDYEDYLARLAQVPEQIDKTMDLMRLGMESGWVQPKVPLRSLPGQIKAQIDGEAADSPFYTPFGDFPEDIEEADQERLAAEGLTVIADRIKPAYGELLTFITDEYLPAARDEVGAWALPDGAAYYAYRVKRMTTTDMTPDEIHALGLREVARIKTGMMDIVKEAGFGADFDAFTKFLRTDDQFYHKTAEDLLEEYRDICKRLNAQLPNLFGKLPRTGFIVEAMPDYQAPSAPTAYYRQPSADGSRPGTFMANTYDLRQRPTYEMEALSIHEVVPGHHLQIALAQELENVPKFRMFGGFTVFTEGWGLYSESLGEELGFYRDPYSKFGQLSYEMWRAVRLVVDTGMHHKRWTRQQAIDFFHKNTGLSEHNIIAEVDRYIVWPGQALAYKIGELKIKELRAQATEALGDDFDIREFHDTVLEQGSIPLNLLEKRVAAWMDAVRRSAM